MTQFSNAALVTALFLYAVSFFIFVLSITGKRWSNRDPEQHVRKWSRGAFVVSLIGWISHLTFFFTRWYSGGHIPTSNMFEFMTFLAMMIVFAFLILYLIYRKPVLGVFAMPVGVIILAYASVFPWEVQPLIPALNSYWLKIHVTTAATGEAFFAVGFAGGLMYLVRTVNYNAATKLAKKAQRGVEFTLFAVLLIVGFVCSVFLFRALGYEAEFTQLVTRTVQGETMTVTETVTYTLPPFAQPYDSEMKSMDAFLGMEKPLFSAPSWMHGVNAGRKLNMVIWSLIAGLILYGLCRLAVRKPLGQSIQPLMEGLDPEDLDEISYRAIAIGFPIFTLGALIFAMIWAHMAWGRFWGWDPKEVWALITWLFYSVYLHLRLSKGWQGMKSSWLAVIGFIVVMFTLVGVNLIIAGLHSYAGV